jgi:hypothetical protein
MRMKMMFAAAMVLAVTACNAAGANRTIPTTGSPFSADSTSRKPHGDDTTSLLKLLSKQGVIGSTVDPQNGDQNPYGLAYVSVDPFTKGSLKKGDLVVCNFNNKTNVAGAGTTLEILNSKPGSKPQRFAHGNAFKGCSSLQVNAYDQVWVTPLLAQAQRALNPNGKTAETVRDAALVAPWSSTYVTSALGYPPGDGLFVADSSSGTILRIDLGSTRPKPPVTPVITGFATNRGKAGSILGPSGMQYDAKSDTMYVVDGVNNTVVAIQHAYNDLEMPNAIKIGANGKTFSGPKAADARLVYAGKPLNGPISSTLLPNHNLIIGNTLGKNLMVEMTPHGKILGTRTVDSGAAGALFGIVSTGATDATTKIYFNDDNANNVQVLQK